MEERAIMQYNTKVTIQ